MSRFPYGTGKTVCSVLRCAAPGAHVVRMAPLDAGLFETAVCQVHKQAIDAGAQWTYDTAEDVIYMGLDVAAAGHHVVRSIRLSHLETLMPDLGYIPIIAHFACRTRGFKEEQNVVLVFNDEMVLAFIDALVRLFPRDRLQEILESRPDKWY